MNAKYAKIAGLAMVIMAFGLVCIVTLHAQPGNTKSSAPPITTNWVGCLVVGGGHLGNAPVMSDPMPGSMHPPPTTLGQVEIGLRSDGVVLWRLTPKTN